MCFYHDDADYDWSPKVVEVSEGPATGRRKCSECRRWINPGEWMHRTYMQQNDPDEWEGIPELFDEGETYTYTRCEPCNDILNIIQEVEEEEGCEGPETRPLLTELEDALTYNAEYVNRAIRTKPALANHLGWLGVGPDCREDWETDVFEWDDLEPIDETELGVAG